MVTSNVTILQKETKENELPLTLKTRSIQPMMHLLTSCYFYEFLHLFSVSHRSNIVLRLVPSITNATHSFISTVNNTSQYTGR